ncbi:transposase [Neisseria mucosa]|nr:transposase [Neisseria mucosa]
MPHTPTPKASSPSRRHPTPKTAKQPKNKTNPSNNHTTTLSDDPYSGVNLNQDKATKPQTVQIVRQGKATPYWFKFNPL